VWVKRFYVISISFTLVVATFAVWWQAQDHDPALNVPREFPTVQAALDQASEGDLILVDARRGPYRESLVLASDDVELRSTRGRAVIEGDTQHAAVVSIRANDVTFSGFELRGGSSGLLVEQAQNVSVTDNTFVDNFGIGIMLFGASHVAIQRNVLRGNVHGIWLSHQANDNVVSYNEVHNSMGVGIALNGVSQNQLDYNVVSGNATGIVFTNSQDNVASRNDVRQNANGVVLEATSRNNAFDHNLIENNAQGIALFNTFENRFEANRVRLNGVGIRSEIALNNAFVANLVEHNDTAISLSNSSGNTVDGNAITNNGTGVRLSGLSRENTITKNNIFGNQAFGLNNGTAEAIDVRHNFWGDPAGARRDAQAPGAGDVISGPVTFDPWLVEQVGVEE